MNLPKTSKINPLPNSPLLDIANLLSRKYRKYSLALPVKSTADKTISKARESLNN